MKSKDTIVTGIGRNADSEATLTLQLRRRATDDEMRAIYYLLNPLPSRNPANIEGDEIVIRVPISAIPHAAEVAFENALGQDTPKVIDVTVFARELVEELNRESEDGTTPVHAMLDAVVNEAAERGAEGLSS